jgi:hypothetical protein
MGLLYSLHVGNRVIVHSVSVVLGLRILIDIACLAGSMCSSVGHDNPIVTFRASSRQKVWLDLSALVEHPLWCLFSNGTSPSIP